MRVIASANVHCHTMTMDPETFSMTDTVEEPPTLYLAEGVASVIRYSQGQYHVFLDTGLSWSRDTCMVVVSVLDTYGTSTTEGPIVAAQIHSTDYFLEGETPYIVVNTKRVEPLDPFTPNANNRIVMSNYVDFNITVMEPGVLSGGGPTDEIAPTMANLYPPMGSAIAPDATVSFRILDNTGLSFVPVFVEFPSGAYEVIYDGTKFAQSYRMSSLSISADGYDFTIKRMGGWPGAPRITTWPVDTSGNVGV